MNFSDREAIERLDAYLDAIAAGHVADTPALDAGVLAADRALRMLGAAPDPSPHFAIRLRRT
jgi:hypothetical protein